MEPEVLTMLLGIALAALVAACGAGFKWMRTDFRDLRSHIDSRFTDHITTTNERFAEVNRRLDRLENRFDGLERRFDGLERRFDGLEAPVRRSDHGVGQRRVIDRASVAGASAADARA